MGETTTPTVVVPTIDGLTSKILHSSNASVTSKLCSAFANDVRFSSAELLSVCSRYLVSKQKDSEQSELQITSTMNYPDLFVSPCFELVTIPIVLLTLLITSKKFCSTAQNLSSEELLNQNFPKYGGYLTNLGIYLLTIAIIRVFGLLLALALTLIITGVFIKSLTQFKEVERVGVLSYFKLDKLLNKWLLEETLLEAIQADSIVRTIKYTSMFSISLLLHKSIIVVTP